MKRTGRGIGWLALAALVVACGGTRLGTAGRVPGEQITLGTEVLVLTVDDYIDEEGLRAANSGASATYQWRGMLSGKGFSVETAPPDGRDAAFATARQLDFTYLLESRITGWHDATAEWQEIPDRVELEARMYRVSDEALVAWGFDEEIGATSDDKVEPAHRLLKSVVRRLLTQMLQGDEITEKPPGT